ncbi:MAG: hypothetical protein LBM21_00890 [Coriobacteriales bacterium]|jgi:hypothetical protein|nr:hypothetical protein [Coriobacteriales bacterium]
MNDWSEFSEEDAERLDKYYTENTIDTVPGSLGIIAAQENLLNALDATPASYVRTKAETAGKTPAQVVDGLIYEAMGIAA